MECGLAAGFYFLPALFWLSMYIQKQKTTLNIKKPHGPKYFLGSSTHLNNC